ncbi:PAS domain S-box protein, partial [candidate division KSB1 bacterium]|nr:PAS domain S-box protein [candidate division KSB1 bacterium]
MWFGTQDGLNRYDGYIFTVFRHDPLDPNSISDNFVAALYEDRESKLWIGTHNGGLNKFDPVTETFTRFRHDPQNSGSLSHNSITALCGDKETLWIGTQNGLNRLNLKTNQITRFLHAQENPAGLSHNYINALHLDRAGALWIGTAQGGLNRYDRTAGSFAHFVHDPANPHSLSDNYVLTIFEDKFGVLWLGTARNGLNKLELSALQRAEGPKVKFTRYNCQATAIVEGSEGMLWIGSRGRGLFRFDRAKEQFTGFVHDPNNPFSVSDAGILSAYIDLAGDLWLGTHGYGIDKYSRNDKAFLHYGRTLAYPNSVANRSVRAIYEDEQGVLWVGGYNGLDRFDRRNGKITHFQYEVGNPASLPSKEIFTIYPDPASNGKILLLGFETNQGLAKFDGATGRVTPYPRDPASHRSLIRHPVYVIHRERSGVLWIGTDAGLFKYDEAQKDLRQYRHDPKNPQSLGDDRVLSLCEEANGTLWVGTDGGLHRFDRANRNFIRYRHDPRNPFSLSHDRIRCIYAARNGALWISTAGGGLNRFERESERFTSFTSKDGLPNDVVYGILEDEKGNLWLSTNNGISKFNPQTLACKNYEASDGLQSNEFNTGAYFRSKTGELFFGGINGVTAFFPDRIKENPYVPPLVFTGFKEFNHPAKLDTAIAEIKKIKLDYRDAVFSLEFAALNYTAPEKNQYAFRMEGFNEDWVELGTKREVTFTNLDPGEYVLRVKGSNNDGIWNETGASIAISIAPAFYQTKWFAALCALLLGLTVYGGYRLRVHRHEVRAQQLERLVAERTEQLRESEAKMRAIFDHTPDFIVVIDCDRRIQLINHTASGFEREKVIGTSIYDYILPEYHQAMRNAVQRVFETGSAERLENEGASSDGTTSWYLTTIAPLPRDDKVQAIVILATNITERKRTEEALKQSEELFRMLYDNTPVMMHSLNKNGELVSVNEYWLKVMGYTREEVIGQKGVNFLTETSRQDAIKVSIPRFFEAGEIGTIERQWIKKNGEVIEGLLSAAPVRNKQGEIERSLAFFVDITIRKRAERVLRESEAKFRSLAESITVGAFIFHGTKMRYVNSAAEDLSGYTREELLTMDFGEVIHPDSRALVKERGMARQRGEPVPSRYEVRLLTKQGEARWIDFTATMTEFEGQPAVLGTALDITARKQMEEQVHRYTNELENLVEERTQHIRELERQRLESEKLAATGRMAARIAHEINNPLGGIQTAFRLVSRAVPTDHRHYHYIGKIEKEIERISRIVRQMLELHKPHVEAPKAFRPEITINDVLALLKPQLLERGIKLKSDLTRAQRPVTLPENMLRQVLYNVVLNAVEASPCGSPVHVAAHVEEHYLEITIADHGEGITEQVKARIFEPFFTTKNAGGAGGMGLGLSICKNLVEAMSGTITLHGVPAEGTTCRITIPLQQAEKIEKA